MRGWIQQRSERSAPWRARYYGADGRERSKSFERKIDAERWLSAQLAKLDRGEWVDPDLGKVHGRNTRISCSPVAGTSPHAPSKLTERAMLAPLP